MLNAIFLLALLVGLLTMLAYPLSRYLMWVSESKTAPLGLSKIESGIYRLAGINHDQEMTWKRYAGSVILFSILGVLAVMGLQLLQHVLPLNPQEINAPTFDSVFNTATSFVTNTNWQAYSGETAMSYLTQMLGLGVQNFASAATGIAVVFALVRGLIAHQNENLGNFWVDITRICLYLLLPIAFISALFMVSQGVIQSLSEYVSFTGLEGQEGLLPMGPNASQETIKLLGTNGGGFFNANSAHPFSNPSFITNFVQMFLILIIPIALCFYFGRMLKDMAQGWTIYAVMTALFVMLVLFLFYTEMQSNSALQEAVKGEGYLLQSSGNLEGKESRFGIISSALFTAVTTAASCGAVNNMHDSLMPLSGIVPLFLMQTGEIVYGGVGSGLYGMLIFVILTVFLAGLMIGRTPEYLGKKVESQEMKLISIAMLVGPSVVLLGTLWAALTPSAIESITNPGSHGFSQLLYALTSATNNNGSAFAGLGANTPFLNYLLGFAMLLGRFGVIIPMLALAGSFAVKKRSMNAASFPTKGLLFASLLFFVVLTMGALTYVPALVLGPVVDHLMLFN